MLQSAGPEAGRKIEESGSRRVAIARRSSSFTFPTLRRTIRHFQRGPYTRLHETRTVPDGNY